ncbi:MAG: thioredoxin domain-containing protein [Nitrospinae bacterium]|nr:thioredoxin domain-containing protein [Nitrospinota bacterium]
MLNKSKKNNIGCLILFSLLLFFPSISFSDPVKRSYYSNNPIVAEVDGEPIHLDDLKHVRIQDALVQLHQMKTRALKERVLEKLAKKHPEFTGKAKLKVSDAEVKNFYEQTPGIKELGSLQQMRAEIQDYLRNSYRNIYIEQQFQHAVEKGWAKVYLTPPNDFHLVAGVGTAMLWSEKNKSARVLVLEYSDFQCPFCKRVQGTLQKIRKKYPHAVQFGYRHFPLPFHEEAKVFAQAVECARDQGKFWELQAWFYKNLTQTPSDGQALEGAKVSGVKDIDEFQSCLKKGKYLQRVEKDIRDGVEIGIQGTPTFLVGSYDQKSGMVSGEMFSGAVSEEKFVKTIEKYLALTGTEAKLNP